MRKTAHLAFLALLTGMVLGTGNAIAQPDSVIHRYFPNTSGTWARQTMTQMTLDEKIGQLFMVAAYTNEHANDAFIENLIRNHHLGGVIFMQGGPRRQLAAANRWQAMARHPLLVAQDAEWGPSMRLDSMIVYPRNLTVAAVASDSLLMAYGQRMATECRAVGVQVNFAPVVDVNNNPMNPVINDRAFGDSPQNVAYHGIMVGLGMQRGGVMAVAKHFPGHGDTDSDSHLTLPIIRHSRARIDSLELRPFAEMFRAGIQGVMTAHLYIPSLDPTPNQATTLSRRVVQGMLVDSMRFGGLIFTDALSMQGVARYYRPGEVDVRALMAGNDVLLFSQDVPRAVRSIKDALAAGAITMSELDRHVFKILLAKESLGLHQNRNTDPANLERVLASPDGARMRRDLYRAAVTLVDNRNNTLPINNLGQQRVAYVQVGYTRAAPFYQHLRAYTGITQYLLPKNASNAQVSQVIQKLKAGGFTTVVVGVFELGKYPARYGFSQSTENFFQQLRDVDAKVCAVIFGTPYAADFVHNEDALIITYEEALEAQQAAAEAVFGAFIPRGRLPVKLRTKFQPVQLPYPFGAGRFGFGIPEDVGMDSGTLQRLDTIANNYINVGAMPGCAIYLLRGNQIVWHKAYGHHTFEPSQPVEVCNTVYDLASVTKVAATTLMAMKLYEQGQLDLHAPLVRYIPELRGDAKANIKVIQLLQHQAGFIAHYPFYKKLQVRPGVLDPQYVRHSQSEEYSIPIGHRLWLRTDYPDTAFARVLRLPADPDPQYVYSDIDMILLGKVLERISGKPMDVWLKENIYGPLGMSHTMWSPGAQEFEDQDLAFPPTADAECTFRNCRVEGFVNDDNAALFGGVAGHAGLFANGYDLLKLGLMLKNCGAYGDRAFFSEATINYWTQPTRTGNRRGLGWDKPETRPGLITPTSREASNETYGHLGFTGTSFWVDPTNDLVFVVLTNRTYPNADEQTIYSRESVRIQFMDVVYRSIATHRALQQGQSVAQQ